MNIAVYCGSSSGNKEAYLKGAIVLGTWIGNQGHTLICGGEDTGLMGAIEDAVLSAGGKVVGVLPKIPQIQAHKHPGLTRYMETETIAQRRATMMKMADAYIAMPGGLETLNQAFEIMNLRNMDLIQGKVVFYNVMEYYQSIKEALTNMVKQEFSQKKCFEDILFSEEITAIEEFLAE
ncbi:MAG: TIGR00730 family Rossman fold protein [Lachnospiraceae bacterium]|nr:TIGR00730 family Rossman fold protein [Lachnospiraceae bacterium]